MYYTCVHTENISRGPKFSANNNCYPGGCLGGCSEISKPFNGHRRIRCPLRNQGFFTNEYHVVDQHAGRNAGDFDNLFLFFLILYCNILGFERSIDSMFGLYHSNINYKRNIILLVVIETML